MREHRDGLQKPTVYLTFDLERDYLRTGYLNPPSFEGVNSNVPRILDEMEIHHATGTFFVTPEVMENCEDITREIQKKHALGLHSHAYYQPEFKGWPGDGDCFSNYTREEKERMALRDVNRYQDCLGDPKLFRIGRLEPDQTILRTINKARCLCDSSYHIKRYGLMQKMRVALLYDFQEMPVNFHLYRLTTQDLEIGQSVILVHPLTPPEKIDPQVYDEERLIRIVDACSEHCEFKDLMSCSKELARVSGKRS